MWVFFLDHPLVYRLPSHYLYPVLAVPHSIPRQKNFILFSCSPWHSHLDKGWVFSLTNSYGMHLVIPAHLSLFWVVCHLNRTFLQTSVSRNPIIDFPPLPIVRPYLFLPLTHGILLLYWLGTRGWCLRPVLALL